MKDFSKLLSELLQFKEMTADIKEGRTPVLMSGLSQIHKSHFIYGYCQNENAPALLITSDDSSAVKFVDELNAFFGEEKAMLYPTRDFIYRDVEGISREYEHQRLKVLENIAAGGKNIIVTGAEALLQYTIPPKNLAENTIKLSVGDTCDIKTLIQKLVQAGYSAAPQVDGVCQFSHRGGILDIFPPHTEDPFRIEFWDDEIDSIAPFKIETQRREGICDSIDITPAREVLFESSEKMLDILKTQLSKLTSKSMEKARANISADIDRLNDNLTLGNVNRYLPLIYPKPATIFDYISSDTVIFFNDPAAVKDTLKTVSSQIREDTESLLEEGLVFPGCDTFSADYPYLISRLSLLPCVIMETFERVSYDIPVKRSHGVNATPLSPWSGEYGILKEELEELLDHKYFCVVMAGTERAAAALTSDLLKSGFNAVTASDISKISYGQVTVVPATLPSGFEYPEIKLTVKTQGKIAASKSKRKSKPSSAAKIKNLSDLTVGDLVVHTTYGVGIFGGIVKREFDNVIKDYIKINYAGSDVLYVAVNQLDLVTKYIGAKEDSGVKLNKLNSVEWSNTKKRVRAAVKDMAKELTELYAKRLKTKGYAFSKDTEWQREFEQRFPYEETGDQLRCIDEIKSDMERPSPMDRLLCGDVGFGKTEVAIRAAFKCVMEGKQCAVLVPTTILAWQHYKTFCSRMENYPIKIDILSRFRTPKQQKQIITELKKGLVDIVIGTHRVIQNDVDFKDLGLCIIDEEQRFGVAHKEKFKELRNNVDVLTLSATPIPRTLNMAMSGIRDMSVIEEAPQDRFPVQTYVIEHNWGIIEQALKKELRRGGQAFYLHNRVESIETCAFKLQQLLPDANITVAHGKMSEEQLSKIWQQLVDREIDILVCTTIIETGVDVSNCNTMIIEDADKMGLSQLYQLRGRVGRSSRRAYAYLTFTQGKALTDIATKRLSAIKEFTSFGSGFRIAMRDLEIRGAGSILGGKQHGHMEAVGYDMYIKMLGDAIAEERGEVIPEKSAECAMDLRIDAHIPEKYISDLTQRIDIYKKIAVIKNNEDAMDVLDELIDRFGDPPQSVKGLVDVALIRNRAAIMGFAEIKQDDKNLIMIPAKFDMKVASELTSRLGNRVTVVAKETPYFTMKIAKGQKPLDALKEMLDIIEL